MKRKFLIVFTIILLVCPCIQANDSNQDDICDFCYKHRESDNMLFDCKEIKSSIDSFPTILCYDPIKQKSRPFTPNEKWERIEGDDCQKPGKYPGEVPKGLNNE